MKELKYKYEELKEEREEGAAERMAKYKEDGLNYTMIYQKEQEAMQGERDAQLAYQNKKREYKMAKRERKRQEDEEEEEEEEYALEEEEEEEEFEMELEEELEVETHHAPIGIYIYIYI